MPIVILILGIIAIIVLTTRFKVHPFLALIFTAYGIAIAGGVPLISTEKGTSDVGGAIQRGFGNTMTSIGLVIVFGCIIGTILEKSGAAFQMADTVVKFIGKKCPALAMSIVGYIVSIPVFCDSGYVILTPFRRALTRRTGVSPVMTAAALSTGLYATHVMVPPTPGPVAAAANLELSHRLFLVILVGLMMSALSALIGYAYAVWIGKRISIQDNEIENKNETLPTTAASEKLPSCLTSFLPIILPIVLMAAASLITLFPAFLTAEMPSVVCVRRILQFAGTPVNALGIGMLCSFLLIPKHSKTEWTQWIGEGVASAATILIITAAGGSLGEVLKITHIGDSLGEFLSQNLSIGIFVPFLIAATLKTAQGSSTVAMTTTSALMLPLLGTLGLDSEISRVFVVMAIGAGSMTVSHANDSFFWVVTRFSGLNVKDAYKVQTLGTLVQGTGTMFIIFLLSQIFLR